MITAFLVGAVLLTLLLILAIVMGETHAALVRRILWRVSVIAGALLLIFLIGRVWISQSTNCQPNCVALNLMGRDLSNKNLRNVNFVEANLRDANLSGADLRGADLSGADLLNANLENANLENTWFVGTNLTQAQLRNTNLVNTRLIGADLVGADLTGVDLTQANLGGAYFAGAKLVEANLQGTNIAGVGFTGADLNGANLTGAQLRGARLSQANLSGSFLQGADLSGAWFNIATLTGADLTGANLSGAALIGANLGSVKLDGARLFGAVLIGAQMKGVSLDGADLSSVRLFQVELTSADLLLDPALQELNELQLSQIRNDVTLTGVTFNSQTTWPSGKDVLLTNLLGQQFVQQTEVINLSQVAVPPVGEADFVMAGSSTVAPLSIALYNEYIAQGNTIQAAISSVGTSGGFQLFCTTGESDIVMASRPISDGEREACATLGRAPVELRIGADTVVVITDLQNGFATDVTTEELALLLTVERWFDVNADWPPEMITRYVPTADSGTFQFLVEQIFPEDPEALLVAPQTLMSASGNDIALGVATTPYAVGFTSYAFYQHNAEVLNVLALNGITPDSTTVESGEYLLARPLYLYVDASVLKAKPEAAAFLRYYLAHVNEFIDQVGYYPLSDEAIGETQRQLRELLR